MQKIDQLPKGAEFSCNELTVDGDRSDEEGRTSETLQLWTRDPLECIKELIGNPAFADHMEYRPKRLWKGPKRHERRVFNEAWSADWWWKTQVSIRCCHYLQVLICFKSFSGQATGWVNYSANHHLIRQNSSL